MVDDAIRGSPPLGLGWVNLHSAVGTRKLEHPYARVQGHSVQTELGWEEKVSGHGRGRGQQSCHIWAQNSENSKNSKFKPGFPGQLESK